ncbi:MAG: flagella basal body P-ring formation protein FlgA [Bdellovibrionales bacterium GWA2_49_15]|nr:MAG: flagella basal body P-ring formation protein FlgA [Bdellovibrionales bacterium GWA2_49_15]
MKYFIFVTLFLISTFHSPQACEIELCSKFLILDSANPKSGSLADGIIKNSNCAEEDQKKVVQFLTQTHGVLNTAILQRYFSSITFRPKQIEIQKISREFAIDYSKTQLMTFIEKVHFHKGSLCVENSEIQTSCDSCTSAGKKNITLLIRGNKINYTIPIDLVLKTQVKAYIANRSFAPGDRLDPSQLSEVDLLTEAPAQTQINFDKIRFYSPTHNLTKGDVIKTTDLLASMVVRPGKTSRVIFKSDNMSIQTEGRALQGATFGQTVQVQLKHKTISALATDFDEVTVEL